MSDHPLDPQIDAGSEQRRGFSAPFIVGAVVVLLLFGGLMLLTDSTQRHQVRQVKLPFGAEEQAYAPSIHFSDIELSHSSNMLNQEFIFVNGRISNDGSRTVRGLAITIEFHDPFNQVILRESQQVLAPSGNPFGPRQQRDFQVTIEQRLPATWNQQDPSILVTGLLLQ